MTRSVPHDEDLKVSMVLRSGTTTVEDKGNLTKEDIRAGRETYLEAGKRFTEVSTPDNRDKPMPDKDPSMLTTLLERCMKLIHDNKAVKGLQELINRCVG